MRPRRNDLIAGIALAVIGGIIWLLVPAEPRYQGKRLSVWLRSLDRSPMQFHASGLVVDTNHPAAQAILHMGSEAVPFLIRELRARDSAAKIKLMELLRKQSLVPIELTPAFVRQRGAIEACFALGPTAKAAIPELTERLSESRISQTTRTFALAAMGPDALPFMISALTNRDPQVRICMASAFRNVPYDAEEAVPALITCLRDPDDYRIRVESAYALAHINKRPDLVLPALTNNLDDTNEMVRSQTASALARFRAAFSQTQ
jgi:hypothetical protein